MASERLPAEICNILEPNEFYIRCIKAKSSARNKLHHFSETVAKDHKDLRFDDPEEELEVGQLVYVKHGESWTRARIVEVYKPKQRKIWIKVLLIDKGIIYTVLDCFSQVVDIPDKKCAKVPAQCKKLRLEGKLQH